MVLFKYSFSYLIVMGRQLIQELFDAVFLSWAVNVGNLILRQAGEVQLDLQSQ